MPEKNTYSRPYIGQVFKLVQNEHVTEYGSVVGFKITGGTPENPTWSAAIESPLSHTFRFYHDTTIGDWKPCTAEEMAVLRGIDAMLAECVARQGIDPRLEERLAALEKSFAELLAKGGTGAPPAPPPAPPAPPAPQTNGRTPRVQTPAG